VAIEKRNIPRPIKRSLIEEAGGKCANPGCSNTTIEFHHIKHWAVFKAHNAEDMIAICPTCHRASHGGPLSISDETLRDWKRLKGSREFHRDVLCVEPAPRLALLTGSLKLTTNTTDLITFRLSNNNTLAFRVEGREIMLLRSTLLDLSGVEVLHIEDNRVKVQRDDAITFHRRPGRVGITVPASDRYIYPEMLRQMQFHEPHYGRDGRIISADLEVVGPGLVRVLGAWAAPEGGVIITLQRLSCLIPGFREPISHVGDKGSTLVFDGGVDGMLFGFGPPKRAGSIYTIQSVLHNRPKF